MSAEVTPKVFAILSALVEERAGLSYGLRDRELFADKVVARMREAGFDSVLDYYYFLRYDAGSAREIEALVDALVVTETYFFREADVLRVALEQLVVPAARAGARPRIWSAACASGEEPLTVAMMLDEAGVLDDVDIVASDISLRAFERAHDRGWSSRAGRALPPGVLGRWMTADGERYRVEPRLVRAVEWRQANLLDDAALRALGTFDLVLCRNVLIYFSDATILRVIQSIATMLRRGGRLVVGASESLLRFGTLLECEERAGAFLYRSPS